uniref:Uncharacterized protein n=1 Tax=viral metagenome TaxID=1070528 RepID=A0A6C0LID0_9ZZZZ
MIEVSIIIIFVVLFMMCYYKEGLRSIGSSMRIGSYIHHDPQKMICYSDGEEDCNN